MQYGLTRFWNWQEMTGTEAQGMLLTELRMRDLILEETRRDWKKFLQKEQDENTNTNVCL